MSNARGAEGQKNKFGAAIYREVFKSFFEKWVGANRKRRVFRSGGRERNVPIWEILTILSLPYGRKEHPTEIGISGFVGLSKASASNDPRTSGTRKQKRSDAVNDFHQKWMSKNCKNLSLIVGCSEWPPVSPWVPAHFLCIAGHRNDPLVAPFSCFLPSQIRLLTRKLARNHGSRDVFNKKVFRTLNKSGHANKGGIPRDAEPISVAWLFLQFEVCPLPPPQILLDKNRKRKEIQFIHASMSDVKSLLKFGTHEESQMGFTKSSQQPELTEKEEREAFWKCRGLWREGVDTSSHCDAARRFRYNSSCWARFWELQRIVRMATHCSDTIGVSRK